MGSGYIVLQIARNAGMSSAVMFFEFDQRSQKILRVHKSNALALRVALRAVAEHAHAFGPDRIRCRRDIVDIEAKMVDAAARIALEEFGDRGIGTRWLHQFDSCIAELDVSKPHALLRVDIDRADLQSVLRVELARRGFKARDDDRNMTQTCDHEITKLPC